MSIKKVIIIIAIIIVAVAAVYITKTNPSIMERVGGNTEDILPEEPPETGMRVAFSSFDPDYEFFGTIPEEWDVEYVPKIESINVYDRTNASTTSLDKSQIFIRKFTADNFLTLSTVFIFARNTDFVQNHASTLYSIQKKPEAADFPHQPWWRNETKHKVLDIRYRFSSPSIFYVISYSPELKQETFDAFIESLVFFNDANSLHEPIASARDRITKKPYGIEVFPETSPIPDERFSGWHTGTDFEIFPDELTNNRVPVTALCGGPIIEKRSIDGYGGTIVQECYLQDEKVQVVYGHLALFDLRPPLVGDYVEPGRVLSFLGGDKSEETDGERKHLHVGIYSGDTVDLRGYVQAEDSLSNWINYERLDIPTN